MNASPSPATAAPRRSSKGPIVASVAAVVLLVVAWVLFWEGIQWGMWINGANRPEYFDKLVAERDDELNRKMARAMRDADRGFDTRVALGFALVKKDRIHLVENALQDADLRVRTVALKVLRGDPPRRIANHFALYADDPAYRVRETLVEWVQRGTDDTRAHALAMLNEPLVRSPEIVPAVRGILSGAPGAGGAPGPGRDLRVAAIGSAVVYQDCESVTTLLALAKGDPEPQVKLRAMQGLEQLSSGEKPPCAATLTEAMVQEAVDAALAHPGDDPENRAPRMGALIVLAKHPEWAKARIPAIRARLAPSVPDVERRSALSALLASKDQAVVDEFPRWFHDPMPIVRGEAATIATWTGKPFDDRRFHSCLVGFVRDETAANLGDRAWVQAITRLRELAKEWVGFPPARRTGSGALDETLRPFLKALYVEGRAEGVTREQVADAWFRWLAADQGLSEAGVVEAATLRDAFWAKARAGDVEGARGVLAGPAGPAKSPDLFTYEQGWLLAKGP
jgi:hypothetical protein